MPLDLVRVHRVSPMAPFYIHGETIEEHSLPLQVFTWDAMKASLCRRAQETNQLVWIGWRDTRKRDKELITVELDATKWNPDA